MTEEPDCTLAPHWEHAHAAWLAEEENSRRHATRKALIVGIPLASTAAAGAFTPAARAVISGLKSGDTAAWICAIAAVVAAYNLAQVLIRALPIRDVDRTGKHRSVSEGLTPIPISASESGEAQCAVDAFVRLSDKDARAKAVGLLLMATHELHKANERTNQRLQEALASVSSAFGAFAFAVLSYFLMQPPPASG